MKEEKLEQLRKVFRTMINDLIVETIKDWESWDMKKHLGVPESYIEKLIYEVKIRNSGRKISKYLNKKEVKNVKTYSVKVD